MPRNTIHKYGWGWRTKNRRLQKYVTVPMEDLVFGTPQEFFDRVTAYIEEAGLTETAVTMETVSGSYGDSDRSVFAITGWREATAEEKAEAQARYDAAQAHVAQREQANLDEAERLLREARPDLFAK